LTIIITTHTIDGSRAKVIRKLFEWELLYVNTMESKTPITSEEATHNKKLPTFIVEVAVESNSPEKSESSTVNAPFGFFFF
jgi:hypothetical protein